MADFVYNYLKIHGSSPDGIYIGDNIDDKNKDIASMLIVNGICFYREYKLTKTTEATCKTPLTKTYTAIDGINKTVILPTNEQIGKTISKTEGSIVEHNYVYKSFVVGTGKTGDDPGNETYWDNFRCNVCGKTFSQHKWRGNGNLVSWDPGSDGSDHKHTACKWCYKLKP